MREKQNGGFGSTFATPVPLVKGGKGGLGSLSST